MKKLMLGNEAVARGVYESGVKLASSYPGTPSTEITEILAKYDDVYSEWAPNEKVAAEVAIGASIAGARAFSAMKHVGLNVASDPLYTASYTGVNGGLVIAVADDPGMHSSQNEQDSRNHAKGSKVPMLEPSNSKDCYEFTKLAYELSEQFDTPVLLRLTTRVSHSQSLVDIGERTELPLKEYKKDAMKYVMMPAMARVKHVTVEERTVSLTRWAEACEINRVEMADTKIGVITAGACYEYVKEALPEASVLKLGMTFPMPVEMIKDFAEKVDKLYVVEELDDVIETHCRKHGVEVIGKEVFSLLGEINAAVVREKILGQKTETLKLEKAAPARPPVLCPGCPHRGTFYVLKKLGLYVSGDIGCYTLGAMQPLASLDACVCMGASVSMLHGFDKVRQGEDAIKSVAVIGDSTFIHSGITSLIDIVYNKGNSTVIILDNSITGMTGHQQNPTTGLTIKNEPAVSVNLVKLAESIGVNRISIVDPFDIDSFEQIVKEEISADEPSVIIAQRPCALLKKVKAKPAYKVDAEKCRGCKMCMKLGCPAITITDGKAVIDSVQCTGCSLCTNVCKFGAITGGADGE